jgi:hypothetical protein
MPQMCIPIHHHTWHMKSAIKVHATPSRVLHLVIYIIRCFCKEDKSCSLSDNTTPWCCLAYSGLFALGSTGLRADSRLQPMGCVFCRKECPRIKLVTKCTTYRWPSSPQPMSPARSPLFGPGPARSEFSTRGASPSTACS